MSWVSLTYIHRLLSEVQIVDFTSLQSAMERLHTRYHIPHVVITSVSFKRRSSLPYSSMAVIGSTMTSAYKSRPFRIRFPAIDAYFSGTGDMFAALMVVRMREAVARVPGLAQKEAWLSSDDVEATELPLAKAAEMVLASMHEVLTKTSEAMHEEMKQASARMADKSNALSEAEVAQEEQLLASRASELRLVRNLDSLRNPTQEFRPEAL
jgi:pyridoxine kinase